MASVEAWNRGERDLGPVETRGPEVPGRSGDARQPRPRGRAPGALRPRAPGRAVCLCRAAQRPAGAGHLREDPLLLVGARLWRPAQLAAPLGDEGSGEAAVRRRRRQPHRGGQPDPAAGDRGARPARSHARRLGARRADRGQDPHDRRPGHLHVRALHHRDDDDAAAAEQRARGEDEPHQRGAARLGHAVPVDARQARSPARRCRRC